VAGPNAGTVETLTNAEYNQYNTQYEQEYGKYIPGTLFSSPRFIPGTKRDRLELWNDQTLQWDGYFDETGYHEYGFKNNAI
jgi:hypothetical protein